MNKYSGEPHVRVATVLLAATVLAYVAPLSAVPNSPTRLSAAVAGSIVTLSWTPPPGRVDAYRVEAGTAPSLSDIGTTLIGATPTLVIPGVPSGTFYVRVRAVARDGESAPSNEVVVHVGDGHTRRCAAPPAAPRGVAAAVTGSVVTLSWTPATDCGTQYVVHAGSFPGGSDIAVAHVGGASGLSASAPHGVYYVHVVAINAFGSAASNTVTVAVGSGEAPKGATPEPAAPVPPPVHPTPPPVHPTGARGGTLRVMTWNIHHGKTKAGRRDLLAQARFIAAQHPDVVALQEVQTWDENQPVRLEQLLEQLTGQSWTRQWAPVLNSAYTEGNLVLTRLPVVSSSSRQMHATGDWNAMYSNRSAARIAVSVSGVNVHVFSTHLDYYNAAHRTAQLLDLMHWAEQYGSRRIVAGDFNSSPGEYWITTMLGDYTDTWRDVTGSSAGGTTINGARFDYLFRSKSSRDDLTPARISVIKTDLSDHAPVIADYRVTP